MRFQGKTVVVTGGGSGIGRATCIAFAEEGADVAVLDIDFANAKKVAEKVIELGRKGLAFKVDVANFSEVDKAMKKIIAEFEQVDILINSAGVPTEHLPFSQLTEEVWDRSIAINLKGVFNPTRAVINHMIERRYGKVISLSSLAGIIGAPTHAQYAAAKAGIIAMSKSLAKEATPLGINVNVIAPGPVITPFTEKVDKEFHRKSIESTLVGRGGTPEEIAALALFLASEDANFIVGQVISPNGGRYI